MRCIYCNTPLAAIDYCPGCGADVTLQKRIVRISNLLYNRGLEKASVRDLSGAITCLKQSLKFNKENIDARNLLGLCYFETGEVVSALCEWVISKNLMPEGNLADHYISQLQNNKNRLDVINQTIRKYNQSIEYCRQGNEDMAVIQLKKVISQNPKLVKAYQLLALLYIRNQDYEKARRLLKKAAAVDNTDTTTLRYLTEIEEATGKATTLTARKRRRETPEPEERGGTLRYVSGNETIIQPTTFRDSSTVATFINIALGILLGGAIVWFMAVPASRQSIQASANQQVTDANTKLASEQARLQDLQDDIDSYADQADQANLERDNALARADSYDELMGVAALYVSGDQNGAADALAGLREDDFDGNAKALYEGLSGAVSSSLFAQYYTAGTTAYVAGDYATATQQLQLAVESDPEKDKRQRRKEPVARGAHDERNPDSNHLVDNHTGGVVAPERLQLVGSPCAQAGEDHSGSKRDPRQRDSVEPERCPHPQQGGNEGSHGARAHGQKPQPKPVAIKVNPHRDDLSCSASAGQVVLHIVKEFLVFYAAY